MASLNLQELQDLAAEGGYAGTVALSSFSAVMLLSAARAFLHNAQFWTGVSRDVTEAEFDTINGLVANAVEEIMSASAPVGVAPDYVFYQEIGSGADGGTLSSGAYRDRLMTIINLNSDGLASLDAGTFNVPTSDYWIHAFALGFRIAENHLRIVDDATGVPVADIKANTAYARGFDASSESQAMLWGQQTLLVGVDYMLQHRGGRSQTGDGQGRAASWLDDNIFAGVILTKVP